LSAQDYDRLRRKALRRDFGPIAMEWLFDALFFATFAGLAFSLAALAVVSLGGFNG